MLILAYVFTCVSQTEGILMKLNLVINLFFWNEKTMLNILI